MKWLVISAILIITLCFPLFVGEMCKTPIEDATYTQLKNLDEFGEVLSDRTMKYITEHEKATISDLITIDGIGVKRLDILREEFK